ncbi:MAG: hypothetical protein KGZ25_13100, partial [Planctomycetes bacterium]|nr:hypothetical protein [Planctomycetota bacterium]
VFRDSFAPRKKGKQLQKKWWYLRTLGSKERVRATSDSLEYESPYGPRFDVSFLQPDTIQAESRDVECKGPLYFAHARPWRRAHDMEPGHKATATETITVTAVGPIKAGQDIVSVLYPREKAEQKPAIAPIGDGAIRVKTKESTDYIFLSPVSFHHKGEKISFAGTCGAVRVYPDEVHLIIAEDSGAVSYGGTTLRSQVPALRVLARDKMKAETIEVRAPKNSIAFSPPKDAKEKPVQTGVKRYEFKDGFAYGFDAKERLEWEENGVRFVGRRGGVVVRNDGTVRMILESGETVSYKKLKSWGAGGPYDLTFHKDRITGRTAGEGRFLYVTGPPGLDRLPTLVIDGQTYALGTHNKTITVPVLEGKHEIEIRIIKQPPITRNWQQWNSE